MSVRDRLIESWNDTQQYFREQDPKRVYYLSMEFLMGRSLTNSLFNLDLNGTYREALKQLGYEMENLVEKERDAALGNGGLGRLAACFLDSMASENLPAWGYGIRYQYGMFRQEVIEGFQHENPDYWLNFGNPWEIERPNIAYPIKFYGNVEILEVEGRQAYIWNSGEEVTAIAYDTPIPGWNTPNTINLRLWSAKPSREFDLESFNTGDYVQAILAKQRAETISAVLYPDDRTYQGKELRLKQQFFMVSATLQDIIRRYLVTHEDTFDDFPDKVALQLNDTHPTIGVPELMRLLMDEHGLGWTKAWDITTRVFSFTNHTVLPEALEKWPVDLVENVLPRHMQIIYDINWRFTQELRGIMGDDYDTIGRMSIIEEGDGMKNVRMAHLALIASHTVNGVAAIHSELIKTTIFKDFYQIMPEKFQNKTNGVTQRRWLAFCNPKLSDLITETLGTSAWIKELDLLSDLRLHCDDPAFQAKWAAVERDNTGGAGEAGGQVRHHRRQGGARLRHGQEDHQAHQRRRGYGERGPGDRRQAPARLPPRLQRQQRGDHRPGFRALAAHLHRGHRGFGNVQHEVRHERLPHHRHHGRCQRRDRRGDWPGEHVHLRRQGGRRARPEARARILQRPRGILHNRGPDQERVLWLERLLRARVRRGVRRAGLLPPRQRFQRLHPRAGGG